VEGKVKPDVLMNLGRVDQLDVDGLRTLGVDHQASPACTCDYHPFRSAAERSVAQAKPAV